MTTYHFPPVTVRRSHSGKCPACGKRVVRSRSFTHTVNPFNRNPDGTVRTPEEVAARVNAEADQWTPDFTHEACREDRS